jgi:hypothetical protein
LGKSDAGAEPPSPQNKEWVLSVTALDVSALPPALQLLGGVMTRNLVEALKKVDHRVRPEEEYLYYTHYAWSKSQAAAAKTLVAKREERDKLLFGGNPSWKYQKNLKHIELEIEQLEAALLKAEAEIPLIAERPVFTFSEDTSKGVFPPPPKPGGEYRFCLNHKADAFLVGKIAPFHGRLYISVKLYTRYTGGFQYEDGVIFSNDQMVQVVDELAKRLVNAVSEAPPASLAVHTIPEEAILLVDGAFAGRGEAGPQEYPPGAVDIESFADNHQPLSISLELSEGERAEVHLNLQPLTQRALTLQSAQEAKVYQGGLYQGETPLPVAIPQDTLEHIHLETTDGKAASVVIQKPDGAVSSPTALTLTLQPDYSAEEQRVEKSRRRFYSAYGRFWIALPIAFVINGIASAHIKAYNRTGNPDLYDGALARYYISIGTSVVAGVALTETFYRVFRYIWTSGEDAAYLVKP